MEAVTERTRADGPAAGSDAPARPSAAAALRAGAVVFGGSVALVGTLVAAAVSATRSLARRRRPRTWALGVLAAAGAYARWVVPWMRGWGATPAERDAPLPGDELVPRPALRSTRAVTIAAPPDRVWPWLAQIGQDRGGFYSYTWLENLAGCRMPAADRIHPEWQHREVGERVMLHPATGVPVLRFEPGRALVLDGWGAFVLEPADDGRRTRLLARARVAGPGAVFYAALVEIPHFVMERRMLRGIARLAERAEAGVAP
jgi:hypothetical protein